MVLTSKRIGGEIHALLGENGAGKTTLMNILYGIYHPDEGQIFINGQRAVVRAPQDALRLGIGMVHQQFRLVPTHTVAENVILGAGDGFRFDERQVYKEIEELAERYNLRVDPSAYIWQLSAGEQQRVEILKALYRGAHILILDEPTSMLTPAETEELLKTLHRMSAEGNTIIFITHKLQEVMAVSHRVTVLRQGKVAAVLETAQTDTRELARLMVGREVLFRIHKEPIHLEQVVLRCENLGAENDKGLPALREVSFSLKAGEILGIAGVAGNGQRELVEVLAGLRPLTEGQIYLNGRPIAQASVRERIDLGLAYIPGERMNALIPNLSIAENLILKSYRRPPFCRGMLLDHKAIQQHAEQLVRTFSVLTPTIKTPVKLLSGGNIQRALLARELSAAPPVLVIAYPTSGLDVGATETIWQLLLEQRQQGRAILLVSDDLEEIMTLSDRVAVMYNGEIMGIVPPTQEQIENIGLMMAGALRLPQEQAV